MYREEYLTKSRRLNLESSEGNEVKIFTCKGSEALKL